jgi:hypothetical protein
MIVIGVVFSFASQAYAGTVDDYDEGIAGAKLRTTLYNAANPDKPLPMPQSDSDDTTESIPLANPVAGNSAKEPVTRVRDVSVTNKAVLTFH